MQFDDSKYDFWGHGLKHFPACKPNPFPHSMQLPLLLHFKQFAPQLSQIWVEEFKKLPPGQGK